MDLPAPIGGFGQDFTCTNKKEGAGLLLFIRIYLSSSMASHLLVTFLMQFMLLACCNAGGTTVSKFVSFSPCLCLDGSSQQSNFNFAAMDFYSPPASPYPEVTLVNVVVTTVFKKYDEGLLTTYPQSYYGDSATQSGCPPAPGYTCDTVPMQPPFPTGPSSDTTDVYYNEITFKLQAPGASPKKLIEHQWTAPVYYNDTHFNYVRTVIFDYKSSVTWTPFVPTVPIQPIDPNLPTPATPIGTWVFTSADDVKFDPLCMESITVQLSVNIGCVATPTNTSCSGRSDATVSVAGLGGNGSYKITSVVDVNNNSAGSFGTMSISGLAAGAYTIYIQEVGGPSNPAATGSCSVTIYDPTPVKINSDTPTTSLCYGDSTAKVSLDITGGTPGYTVFACKIHSSQLDVGSRPPSSNSPLLITDLPGGTKLDIIVQDSKFCPSTVYSVTLSQPPQLTGTVDLPLKQNTETCHGSSDGKAVISYSGGTGSITISPSNPPLTANCDGSQGAGKIEVCGLPSGTNSIKLQDGNNCLSAPIQITILPRSVVTATATLTSPVTCSSSTGDPQSDGVLTVIGSGGNGPTYTLQSFSGPSGSISGNTIIDVGPGFYTFSMTDKAGCPGSGSINIPSPDNLSVSSKTLGSKPSCVGATDGSFIVALSGSLSGPTYTLTFSGSPGHTTVKGSSPLTVPDAGKGTYTFYVSDEYNCKTTTSSQYTMVDGDPISYTTTDLSCPGNTATLRFNLPGTNTVQSAPGCSYVGTAVTCVAGNTYSITIGTSSCTNIVSVPFTNTLLAIQVADITLKCSGTTATVTPSISGGTGPYTITGAVVNPSSPVGSVSSFNSATLTLSTTSTASSGFFNVDVTIQDARGCTKTVNIKVNYPSTFTYTSSPTDSPCYSSSLINANSGQVVLTQAGGTFSSPSSTTLTGQAAGTYTKTSTDGNGCSASTTYTIGQPLQPSIKGISRICKNQGGAPFSYTIQYNNDASFVLQSVSSGTFIAPNSFTEPIPVSSSYSATFTNTNCKYTQSFTVDNTGATTDFQVSLAGKTDATCFGGLGSATFTFTPLGSGGNPSTYTDLQSSPTGYVNTRTFTSSQQCTASTTITIKSPTQLTGTAVDISCYTQEKVRIDVSGGVIPYKFNSATITSGGNSGSMVTSTASSVTFNLNDPAGAQRTWTYSISDQNGCLLTGTFVTQSALPSPIASTATATSFEYCSGTASYTVDLSGYLTGGSGSGYTIQSVNPAVASFTGVKFTVDNIAVGSSVPYTVTIADNRACSNSISVIVTHLNPLSVIDSYAPYVCPSTQVAVTFSNPTGGDSTVFPINIGPPVNYNFNSPIPPYIFTTGFPASTVQPITLTRGACTNSQNLNIPANPLIPFAIAPTTVRPRCKNGLPTSIKTLEVPSGGTGPYYLQSVNPPEAYTNCDSSNPATLPAAIGTTVGWYICPQSMGSIAIAFKDANNCDTTQTLTVAVNQDQALSVNPASQKAQCSGGTLPSVTLVFSGGHGSLYSSAYLISTSTSTRYDPTPATFTFVSLPIDTYTAYVTSCLNADPSDCCSDSTTFTVTSPSPIVITVTQVPNTPSCDSSSDGNVTISASGGTKRAALYQLTQVLNGATVIFNGPPQSLPYTVSGLQAGVQYTAVVTYNGLCPTQQTFTLAGPAKVVITNVVDVSCYDTATTGQAKVYISGGWPGSSFTVTPTCGGSSVTSSSSPILVGSLPLKVDCSFNVLSNYGCSDTYGTPIQLHTTTFSSTVSPFTTKCIGGKVDFTVTVTSGNPNLGPWHIQSAGGNTIQLPLTIAGAAAGNYPLTLVNTEGCIYSPSFMIVDPPNLSISPNSVTLNCYNIAQAITFTGSGGPSNAVGSNVDVSSYQITKVDGNPVTPGLTQTLGVGSHTLQVTALLSDGTVCNSSPDVSVNVTNPVQLVATVFSQTPRTCHDSTDATATIQVSGGTGMYHINCGGSTPSIPSCSTISFAGNTIITGLGTVGGTQTVYSIQVQDANSCSTTVGVTIPNQPILAVSAVPTSPSCPGKTDGYITYTVTGGIPSYSGPFPVGSAPNQFVYSNLGQRSYAPATFTDSSHCSVTSGTVQVNDVPPLTVTYELQACPGNSNVMLTITNNQGPVNIVVSSNETSILGNINGYRLEDLDPGKAYQIVVTDGKLCTVSFDLRSAPLDTNFIDMPLSDFVVPCAATPATTTISCHAGYTCNIIAVTPPSGVTGSSFFTPNTMQLTNLVANPQPYTISVQTPRQCVATTTLFVKNPTAVVVTPPTIPTPTCYLGTVSVELDISGGTPPYTVSPASSPAVTVPSPGPSPLFITNAQGGNTYSVSVTDSYGCAAPAGNVWFSVPNPPQISAVFQDDSCYNIPRIFVKSITPTNTNINVNGVVPPSSSLTVTSMVINGEAGLMIGGVSFTGATTVTLRDKDGCTSNFVVPQLNNPLDINADATNTPPTCSYSTDGTASLAVSLGTSNFTVTGPGTISTADGTTFTITNLPGGNNVFTIKDAKGCTTTKTVNLIAPPPLHFVLNTVASVQPSCSGKTDGKAVLTITGGTGPYHISSIAPVPSRPGAYIPPFSGLTITQIDDSQYNVTVMDNVGCTGVFTLQLVALNSITVIVTSKLPPKCAGSSTAFLGVTAADGLAPYSINVSPQTDPAFVITPRDAQSWEISNLKAGSYQIVVTDSNGCTKTLFETVQDPGYVGGVSAIAQVISCTAANDGRVIIPVSGGSGNGYQMTLSPNFGTIQGPLFNTTSNQFYFEITGLPPTTYNFTITDFLGCSGEGQFTLTEPLLVITHPSIKAQWSMYLPSRIEWSYIPNQNGDDVNLSIHLYHVLHPNVPTYFFDFPATYSALHDGAFYWKPHHLVPGPYVIELRQSNGCPHVVSYPFQLHARFSDLGHVPGNDYFGID